MRFRKALNGGDGVVKQMASMIDVVFLLLIFFMLTLRVLEREGDFNISMPSGPVDVPIDKPAPPPLKLRLVATANGDLQEVKLGARSFGNDEAAFERLNDFVRRRILNGRVGDQRDADLLDQVEVEIDPDFNLNYEFIVKAIGAVSGSKTADGRIVKYLDKIKFAAPRQPV